MCTECENYLKSPQKQSNSKLYNLLISSRKQAMANLQIIPLNSCENFKQSRISADKRFLMYFHYIPPRLTPDWGLCKSGLRCKVTNKFLISPIF